MKRLYKSSKRLKKEGCDNYSFTICNKKLINSWMKLQYCAQPVRATEVYYCISCSKAENINMILKSIKKY